MVGLHCGLDVGWGECVCVVEGCVECMCCEGVREDVWWGSVCCEGVREDIVWWGNVCCSGGRCDGNFKHTKVERLKCWSYD